MSPSCRALPGQTVTPSFEPVNEQKSRFEKDLEERDFEDELDLDEDDSVDDSDDFRSRLGDDQDSAIDREQEEEEGSGAFETLKENYESLKDDLEKLDSSEGSSVKRVFLPSEEDQAAFFDSNFGRN